MVPDPLTTYLSGFVIGHLGRLGIVKGLPRLFGLFSSGFIDLDKLPHEQPGTATRHDASRMVKRHPPLQGVRDSP